MLPHQRIRVTVMVVPAFRLVAVALLAACAHHTAIVVDALKVTSPDIKIPGADEYAAAAKKHVDDTLGDAMMLPAPTALTRAGAVPSDGITVHSVFCV